MPIERILEATRTILITGFKNTKEYEEYVKTKLNMELVAEYYTIPPTNFLFVVFYDLREAIKCYKEFCGGQSHLKASYTISKYEISKKVDDCSEKNLQSSINFYFKNVEILIDDIFITNLLKKYGKIRELRNCKPNQRTVVFYDIRSAKNAFLALNNSEFDKGVIKCRWVWDLSMGQRSEYLCITDELLQGVNILTKKGEVNENKNKRNKLNKIHKKKDVITDTFDKLIINNLNIIEKIVKNKIEEKNE